MKSTVYLQERRPAPPPTRLKVLEQHLLRYDDGNVIHLDPPKEKSGVVYTKPWVVDLILDLAGYTDDKPLHELLLVEPSAGDGSFLVHIAGRLISSCKRLNVPLIECRESVVAYELDDVSASKARLLLAEVFIKAGAKRGDAELLADCWVRTGDYLLDSANLRDRADFVIGNPPYIRLEELENGGALYRSAFSTMIGRADIYVAFYEAALSHLKPGGICGFICADRWMFNQYGSELRRLVTSRYSVEAVLQMHHADAFDREVNAYPAVTMIRNAKQGKVQVASIGPDASRVGVCKTQFSELDTWFKGSDPWPLMEPAKLALLRRIERDFPSLEESGAIVGIGVATGADKIFITKDASLVEPERLLPLAMAYDVKGADVKWSGHYLVNPWNGKGLVDLTNYPKLSKYLEGHRTKLESRHVGKKAPENWYRTIDRVNDQLTAKPKLYLPDFKGRIAPVLDRGETYPHHNLYFIVPGKWDPEVLGGLLISDLAQFFIEAYCVRMRGGYLRFQAQYLRRLRVPNPITIGSAEEESLRIAFASHDVKLANEAVCRLYGLTDEERKVMSNG